jgi:hypothetical protein
MNQIPGIAIGYFLPESFCNQNEILAVSQDP